MQTTGIIHIKFSCIRQVTDQTIKRVADTNHTQQYHGSNSCMPRVIHANIRITFTHTHTHTHWV